MVVAMHIEAGVHGEGLHGLVIFRNTVLPSERSLNGPRKQFVEFSYMEPPCQSFLQVSGIAALLVTWRPSL